MTYRDDFRDVSKEAMWTLPRIVGGVLAIGVVTFGLGFLATGGDLFTYKFWAPKRANAEREVFVNTASYIQGKTEYLTRLRLAYDSAIGDQKAALRQTILTEASQVDETKLPENLQSFLLRLQTER